MFFNSTQSTFGPRKENSTNLNVELIEEDAWGGPLSKAKVQIEEISKV